MRKLLLVCLLLLPCSANAGIIQNEDENQTTVQQSPSAPTTSDDLTKIVLNLITVLLP